MMEVRRAPTSRKRAGASRTFAEPAGLLDEARHRLDALARAQIREHERPPAPHPPGVLLHDGEARADMRREVDLVDDEKVGAGDPGTALARDLLAAGDVDDVDRQVGELGREGRGEVIAAGLDENEIELREAPRHGVDRREVDRAVLADCGVRAAAGLDAHDALLGQRAGDGQDARILLGVDVVGDGAKVVAPAKALAERLHERRLARADRTADADAQRTVRGGAHDRNSRVYWVS